MPLSYQIFDVFSATVLAGNPLAVVFGADRLDTAAMQAIAAEFNLSETIFLMDPDDPANTHKARIFTPGFEMPFAGHPTVGGAVAAARQRGGAGHLTLELPAGVTRCEVGPDGTKATIEAPKTPKLLPGVPPDETLAAALGLDASRLGFGKYRPTRADSGPQWTIIPVADPSDLADIKVDRGRLAELGEAFLSTYVIAPTGDGSFQCRMFAPHAGIEEDPATGSAAVAFAALHAAAAPLADGGHEVDIVQGIEMGRRSELRITIVVSEGAVGRVFLSGRVTLAAEGTLFVD